MNEQMDNRIPVSLRAWDSCDKNVFRQKVLWTFPLYIFLSLHKGFYKTHNRYFIEYEYEEIHLLMILYLDLWKVLIL